MVKEIELEDLINEYEKTALGKSIVFYGRNAREECVYFSNKYDEAYYNATKPISKRFYTIDTDNLIIKKNG